MSDSVLKKQFAERDIQRIRNLVKGKSGDRVTHGVGYTKTVDEHVEGDVWEENGKKWTIVNGVRENITKLDKFKKVAIPLFCTSCKQIMDKQLDPYYFKSYGHCLDCQTTFETQHKFPDCKYIKCLAFDFYIASLNVLIEYDGIGHYKPTFGSSPEERQKNLEEQQKRDRNKDDWAKANNIPMLRIPYWDFDRVEELIEAFILENTKKQEIKQLELDI